MSRGSEYRLEKSRLYHFPHNSAIYEEFDFMLRVLDPKKTKQEVYTFKEICKVLLVEQVRAGKFKAFHPKPYDIFTKLSPPDLETLIAKMGRSRAKRLAEERKQAYKNFLRNPERNYEDFVETQYKPTKTWRQNWVEFVRDYADLAAYCGLLPAFYKNPLGDSEEDGYVISDRCTLYLRGKMSPEEIMMGMKYANSSINLMRYPQFNIRVRPFYSALRLLVELEKLGVKLIDKKLLGAAVGCLRSEEEIQEVADLISKTYGKEVATFNNQPRTPKDFVREGERFSLCLVAFLNAWKLVRITQGRTKLVRITEKGKQWIDKTPSNALFYNFLINHVKPTPLLGYLLNMFAQNAGKGITRISYSSIVDLLKTVVEKSELDETLTLIRDELTPSPIHTIEQTTILLNPLTYQYSITSSTDFASDAEAAFIEKGVTSIIIKAPPIVVTRPPEDMLDQIKVAAVGPAGFAFEDVLGDALDALKIGKVVRLGHVHAGQRYTDLVWEVPIIDSITRSERQLLVIVEAKAGDAIRQFDERVAIDDIINTLKERYSRVLPKIAGLWIWVIDGMSLPGAVGTHGGARPGAKTFLEKMQEMLQLMAYTGRLVVVTALNVDSFIEYYSYLYGAISQAELPLTEVNMQNFWIWGGAFRPINGYVFVYDDYREIRKKLIVSA